MKLAFRTLLAAILLAGAVFGGQKSEDRRHAVRIRQVTFDLKNCVLHYKAESGFNQGRKFHKQSIAAYSIDFHSGRMTKKGGRSLPFTEQERDFMHGAYSALVSDYAFESVMWFEAGGPLPAKIDRPPTQQSPEKTSSRVAK